MHERNCIFFVYQLAKLKKPVKKMHLFEQI